MVIANTSLYLWLKQRSNGQNWNKGFRWLA